MKVAKFTFILILTTLISLQSCKKEEEPVEKTYNQSVQGSNDETARNEYDATIDEIFNSLENSGISTGRSASPSGVILPCGVVKIDSTSGGIYKFRYDSTTNCGNRILSGTISASLISGTQWSDTGAQLQMTFTNYTVLFSANNQVLTFNGSLIITNKDGGKGWMVLNAGGNRVITHTINGVVDITFDRVTADTRKWTITKKRIFKSSNGEISGITWSLEADGPVAETGTGKDGSPFVTTIPSPLIWENCSPTGVIEGPYIATSGEMKYTSGVNSVTAEPGYSYNATSKKLKQVNDCSSEGYKLTFFINGKTTVQFQQY